jgi:hypothetical protein
MNCANESTCLIAEGKNKMQTAIDLVCERCGSDCIDTLTAETCPLQQFHKPADRQSVDQPVNESLGITS